MECAWWREQVETVGVVYMVVCASEDNGRVLHGCVLQVETVGGVYMVVGGVPEPLEDHSAHVAALALHMISAVADYPRRTHNIRIGN